MNDMNKTEREKFISRIIRMVVATIIGVVLSILTAGETFTLGYKIMGAFMSGALCCCFALPVTATYKWVKKATAREVIGSDGNTYIVPRKFISLLITATIIVLILNIAFIPILDMFDVLENGELLLTICLAIVAVIEVVLVTVIYKKNK